MVTHYTVHINIVTEQT